MLTVLRAVDRVADVLDPHRRAVAIGDDHVVIVGRLGELIVGGDGEALRVAPLSVPLAALVVAEASTPRTSSSVRPLVGELGGIDLHADRGLLLAADRDLRHAGDLRDLLREDGVGVVVDRGERQRVRMRAPAPGSANRPD